MRRMSGFPIEVQSSAARFQVFPCEYCRHWGPSAAQLVQGRNTGPPEQVSTQQALSERKGVLPPQYMGKLWKYS